MENAFNPEENEIEIKPIRRGERLIKSEAARNRRRKVKETREQIELNRWARLRREKSKK